MAVRIFVGKRDVEYDSAMSAESVCAGEKRERIGERFSEKKKNK